VSRVTAHPTARHVSTNQAIFGHDHTTLTTFSTIIHHDSDKFKVNNLTYQTKMKENSKNIKTARRKMIPTLISHNSPTTN
jgi:hypothetical protein